MQEAKDLLEEGNNLFAKRGSLVALWQEMADYFYYERADFTRSRFLGSDFAGHAVSSFPARIRRDLSNNISAMLRPANKNWFSITTEDEESITRTSKQWLEWATKKQRNLMYAKDSQFIRATKEGDNDFVTFGQCALSVRKKADLSGLIYRCHHLRDIVWSENAIGIVDSFWVKMKFKICYLAEMFGEDKLSMNLRSKLIDPKKKNEEVEIMHIVVPTSKLNSGKSEKKINQPFVSLYVECDGANVLELKGSKNKVYVLPRWVTVSGSQYATSLATVVALPDARLHQQMALTILEAGEKAVNPPMVAVQDAIRSDISIYAGGVTWADAEYDERTGEVLRPLTQDRSGLPFGLEAQQDLRRQLEDAFYINQLNMPGTNQSGTAYETAQLIQEYIRKTLPLFEPMETEYNGQLCEMTFELALDAGAFGSKDEIPKELSGADIKFRFESPITDAIGKDKGQKYLEVKALLLEAAQLDKSVLAEVNSVRAFKDVISGIQAPASWLNSEEEIKAVVEAEQMQQLQAQVTENIKQGGLAAEQLGKAQQALGEGAMVTQESIL